MLDSSPHLATQTHEQSEGSCADLLAKDAKQGLSETCTTTTHVKHTLLSSLISYFWDCWEVGIIWLSWDMAGESWSHACTNRLILFWVDGQRFAHIYKSPSLKSATAPYFVTSQGIRSASEVETMMIQDWAFLYPRAWLVMAGAKMWSHDLKKGEWGCLRAVIVVHISIPRIVAVEPSHLYHLSS